jgi:glutamate 5-kinase
MTAFSELKQRARSKAHDISDPASDVSISSTLTGKDVAERAMSRVTVVHRTIANSGGGAATDAIAERAVLTAPASLYPNGVKLVEIGFRTDTAVVQDANDYLDHAPDC